MGKRASYRPIGHERWIVRVGILGVAASVSLVAAGNALGAVTPRLVVSSNGAPVGPSTLSISASRQTSDDPVGRIQIFVPSGFTLSSPSPGAQVGTATARVVAGDVNPTAEQPLSGTVRAISPTDPTVAYENASCDTSGHLAAWMVRLGTGRTALSFPIFVDAVSDTGASFGPYVLVACFRAADLPPSDPARSRAGGVIDSFTLNLTRFTVPTTAGGYLWRSLWTPFAAGTGSLDPAGSVEAQSTAQVLAGAITIDATTTPIKLQAKPMVLLIVSGRVLVDNQPQAGVLVRIRHGAFISKLVGLGRVRTASDGLYLQATLMHATQYLQASADLPATDLGESGCQPSFGDIPCLDATTGTGHVASMNMLVKR